MRDTVTGMIDNRDNRIAALKYQVPIRAASHDVYHFFLDHDVRHIGAVDQQTKFDYFGRRGELFVVEHANPEHIDGKSSMIIHTDDTELALLFKLAF